MAERSVHLRIGRTDRRHPEPKTAVGQTWVSRRTWQTGSIAGRTFCGEDIAIIRPEEIRRLPERRGLEDR
jgi:hypothetical protein